VTDFCERNDELVDLALQDCAEPAQSALLGHLAHCARCRATYTRLAEAIDLATAAAPQVQPPAGFELRVLQTLTATARRHPSTDT
jgi:predicted anti-sigma-YlaC factor YlaD